MTQNTDEKVEKPDNPFINLIVNIAIPAIIWSKFTTPQYLGPVRGFVIALLFPICYGIYDLVTKKKFNFISIFVVLSLILTGSIGLLKLDNQWLAIKEAAVPAIIGIAVIVSLKTRFPLVRRLLFNDKIICVDSVTESLRQRERTKEFERLLVYCSWMMASSFFLSAILNYILAKLMVVAPAGTVAYNEQLGKFIAVAHPMIVIPSMIVMMLAIWYLFYGIKKLTGLTMEEVFRVNEPPPKKSDKSSMSTR